MNQAKRVTYPGLQDWVCRPTLLVWVSLNVMKEVFQCLGFCGIVLLGEILDENNDAWVFDGRKSRQGGKVRKSAAFAGRAKDPESWAQACAVTCTAA
jgi:hypothetical protein